LKKVKTHPNKYTIKDMIYPNTISGSALAAHTALSACLDQDLIFISPVCLAASKENLY
jgi:hypothetical protein